ncbi:verprolin [Zopfia rhizophila CBS 207.26]|uniref:Verprolin n=1 Tax=Zopfia rhizophila CBS 207.26 TaxID=1314779 RepID=A0A6A6D923_9PEZI|nr:verprolin [Zopfia rhizophila CBS 207.26]
MPEILPSAVYYAAALGSQDPQDAVSPLDQRHAFNTIIEDDIPRYYLTPRYSPTSTISAHPAGFISPAISEDFPTPKARIFDMMRPSPQPSPRHYNSSSQPSEHRISRADSEFDSLYDVTDDEAEVPLKCSASVKQVARSSRNRYPSIVIPSPSAWPTIEKLRSAMSTEKPSPPQLLTPSNKALSSLASRNLQVPPSSATPSLDGSMTSEEMEQLSCPATPETRNRQSVAGLDDWAGPVQLDTQALETLQHLGQSSSDHYYEGQPDEIREGEMQEVSRPSLGLNIPSSLGQSISTGNTPVSALSIPSPGGFFSSLHSSARHTWSMPKRAEESVPNTSTAEKFYQLPWDNRRNTIAKQRISLAGSTLDGFTDGLPTSRPVALGDVDETLEIKEINPSKTIFQYNEKYHAELQELATANLERTGLWLEEQDELQAALRDMGDMSSPNLSTSSHSRGNSLDKTVKKSVRFEEPQKSPTEDMSPKKIVTYKQGFEYLRNRSRKNDPFIHRQTRAEAMHLHRRCMPKAHQDQLLGRFELTNPVRPSPPRPVSEFYTDDPTVLKERIARAQMERQALDQMLPTTWVLQALKQLNGGKLLSKPASQTIARMRAPRILDVGGVPTNDWAWQVAYDYPYASVTTVYTAGNNLTSNVSGPENHKHMNVPNLWTLPFPNAHFDVISARSLYQLLKTDKPLGRSMDEYDLCLKECYRCLKPGGILEFSLLDADIIQAGRHAQAMGVEFGFNLKTRGYDAAPSKSFLPRLHKAGFQNVQRAWMVLPMGKTAANWKEVLPVGAEKKQEEKCISPGGHVEVNPSPVFGTTVDAAMMTGIVGSWAWERWMLKLQLEMGKEEEKLLEGVVQVLEEGAKEGSGFRYLTGYARK